MEKLSPKPPDDPTANDEVYVARLEHGKFRELIGPATIQNMFTFAMDASIPGTSNEFLYLRRFGHVAIDRTGEPRPPREPRKDKGTTRPKKEPGDDGSPATAPSGASHS